MNNYDCLRTLTMIPSLCRWATFNNNLSCLFPCYQVSKRVRNIALFNSFSFFFVFDFTLIFGPPPQVFPPALQPRWCIQQDVGSSSAQCQSLDSESSSLEALQPIPQLEKSLLQVKGVYLSICSFRFKCLFLFTIHPLFFFFFFYSSFGVIGPVSLCSISNSPAGL